MLEFEQIRILMNDFNNTDQLQEFSLTSEDTQLKMKKTDAVPNSGLAHNPLPDKTRGTLETAPLQPVTETEKEVIKPEIDTNLETINSPMVGTLYMAPSPSSPPFVKKGDAVGKEDIVCTLEAMKLFNEIEADIEGEIVDILVENGQLVEYGEPLFTVKQK